jgi:hypothetical protein
MTILKGYMPKVDKIEEIIVLLNKIKAYMKTELNI